MPSFENNIRAVALGFVLVFGLMSAALADDWQAFKLRGGVFAFVDDAWMQMGRGDVVPDDRIIRTAPNGRVQFRRGAETIDLGPNTQIRIFDRQGETFTVVQQHFGDVAVEAERRNVQHFAVQTRYLAAVVKGTRFSVRVDDDGAQVDVARGQVQVRDVSRKLMVDVTPGQSASVSRSTQLSVNGPGALPPVVTYDGAALAEEVVVTGVQTPASGNGAPSAAASASANANASGASAGGKSGSANAGGTSSNANAGENASNSNAGGNAAGSNAGGNSNGAGNSENSNAGGNAQNSNAGGNGKGNTSNGNGQGNSGANNAGGNSANSNAGGNSNGAGNSGNTNAGGNASNSNAGGNSSSSNAGGNGNGNSSSSNAGGNSGNSSSSNAGGNSGNASNSNAGGNGNGNGGGNSTNGNAGGKNK